MTSDTENKNVEVRCTDSKSVLQEKVQTTHKVQISDFVFFP